MEEKTNKEVIQAKKNKKKTHYFETFIIKVLKQISNIGGITLNAKQQLNSFLCIFAKHISMKATELTIFGNKKTISNIEIKNALELTLSGELLKNSIIEGDKAIMLYTTNKSNKGSRQYKSNILFPPSLVEKFIRNFDHTKIMITTLSPVYLAAVLEYITYEILDISLDHCKEQKRLRITIKDIELCIKSDEELTYVVNKLNLSFLGGGVTPYIHPSLINKKCIKYKKKTNHRFRTGKIALKNIKKYQKMSEYLIFLKAPFEKFVRRIFDDNKNDKLKISKNVFLIIQYFVEQYIVKLLYNSNFLAIHAGRIKLASVDIAFISYLLDNSKNPYVSLTEDISEVITPIEGESNIEFSRDLVINEQIDIIEEEIN